MSSAITPRSIESSLSYRDRIPWCSSSAAAPSAQRIADRPKVCCRLVTISTDNITQANENRSGIGAHWPFLSDPRRIIQKDLDIAEYTDPVNNPMIPHVIVLEPGLVIHNIYNGYWFFGRPTIEELRQDLRVVSRKCRPDWDITTPDLKVAWQQGRKNLFYPYGKTFAQTLGEQS